MTAIRWYRSRRNLILLIIISLTLLLYYLGQNTKQSKELDLDLTRRDTIIQYIEATLQEALKLDKGGGCEVPVLDPYAKEVSQFDKDLPEIVCNSKDWVKCYLSQCRVVPEIFDDYDEISCEYKDIIYMNDAVRKLRGPTLLRGREVYNLTDSDHVKITCTGKYFNSTVAPKSILTKKWTGHGIGYRSTVKPKTPPPGREDSIDVLIFGFDSTSRDLFIRRMPKSYKVLFGVLGATMLTGYNIVGDGTPAALFPILTGKTELELPDVRVGKKKSNGSLDDMPFIFYKLKDDGYHTAYYEDMPWIGTFQYRFKGFRKQPADHYLRAFFLEESGSGKKWWSGGSAKYCVGDTASYKLMINITEQFLKLPGKKFCFTFIADITHDDYNYLAQADEPFADFLASYRRLAPNSLLVVMGDHGARYANVRETLQGKLEERLPLMALVLPEALKQARPEAQRRLQANAPTLTTPHDLHATLLDALGLLAHRSNYSVPGADIRRGLSLFEEIPKNRSCSEAGIEPHWCSCLNWRNVSNDDPMRMETVAALLGYINRFTQDQRELCAVRTLTEVQWVMRQQANSRLLAFADAKDKDGYVGSYTAHTKVAKENYLLKIVVGPGRGVYEASIAYIVSEKRFVISTRDISRTNAYNTEPHCISATHPHLNPYCFCND